MVKSTQYITMVIYWCSEIVQHLVAMHMVTITEEKLQHFDALRWVNIYSRCHEKSFLLVLIILVLILLVALVTITVKGCNLSDFHGFLRPSCVCLHQKFIS